MYNNEPFDLAPEELTKYVGMVYLITNLESGKQYIGKKFFTMAKTRQVKGKKKRYRGPSNWKDYFGSNNDLLTDVALRGEEYFKREILRLCKTKGECSYFEAAEQFAREVLLHPPLFYNEQIRIRVHRSHLKLEAS